MARGSLRRRNGRRLLVDVNLLPFIDIILVLLVVFMVTAPLAMQGIKLDLPKTASSPLETTGKELVISVTKNKAFILEDLQGSSAGQALNLDQLVKRLEVLVANQAKHSLSFRADKNLTYGEVVQIIDELHQAGVTNFALITEAYDSKTD